MTFQDLKLIPPILSALRDMGYQRPSPIQEKAIPPALQGRDVLGCAQTGTGKTCAFAAPILQQLYARPVQGKPRPIRALILTPTRELALQIQESFEAYGKHLPLKSAVIFGGVGQQPQVDKLKAGVDILVATPGRLQDLHDQGFVHVEQLEIFVLDEADRMLDMGFIHDVKKILTWLPQKKQTLFFSATMPPEVRGLVDSLLVDPVKVAVDPVSSPVEIIDQRLFYVDRANKSKLLALLVAHPDVKNALIFTRTKHGANKVASDLEKAGIHAAAIHGNKSQTARQQALSDFKAGKIKALVATDIAARGLDIEELSHVFNYNLPDVPETYVHRIGRTGRAGRGGTAVSFCEFGEKELLAPIEKLLKKPIPVVEGHPYPMQSFEAPQRDKHGKIVNADDAEARQAAREKRERSRIGELGPERGRAQDRQRRAGDQPESEGRCLPVAGDHRLTEPKVRQRPGHAANASVTTPPQRQKEGPDAQPKAPAPKQPQPQQKPAQTAAAGKRQSAGYKASKTLDEALASMAPRQKQSASAPRDRAEEGGAHFSDPSKQSAFERWMAEERAIQAKQQKTYGSRALDGDVIMDATARLLAPKGSTTPAAPAQPARREAPPRQAEREGTRPGHGADASLTTPPSKRGKHKKKPGGQPQPEAAPKASQPPAPGKKEPPKPAPKKAEQARREKPPKVFDRRRGPAQSAAGQKDSTEQQSLMKPYYFNPYED